MPLISEFQFSKEIEDRLLAPIEIEWVAVEKILAGMIQALVAGLVVLPGAWPVMGKGVDLRLPHPLLFAVLCLLIAFLSSALGLTLGCSIGQTQIGLMFSIVLAPMIFFGCTYYPWSALARFPRLQKAVLVQSGRVFERGPAQRARASVSASLDRRGPRRARRLRAHVPDLWPSSVPQKSRPLTPERHVPKEGRSRFSTHCSKPLKTRRNPDWSESCCFGKPEGLQRIFSSGLSKREQSGVQSRRSTVQRRFSWLVNIVVAVAKSTTCAAATRSTAAISVRTRRRPVSINPAAGAAIRSAARRVRLSLSLA